VKRTIKPIAAPIPSKHPPRAVATVCRRREANDQQARGWITESGQRLGPISLTNIATRRLFCLGLTPAHQARTAATVRYVAV